MIIVMSVLVGLGLFIAVLSSIIKILDIRLEEHRQHTEEIKKDHQIKMRMIGLGYSGTVTPEDAHLVFGVGPQYDRKTQELRWGVKALEGKMTEGTVPGQAVLEATAAIGWGENVAYQPVPGMSLYWNQLRDCTVGNWILV